MPKVDPALRGANVLSNYRGRQVRVICEECDRFKTFSGDALIEEHGDQAMPTLLAALAALMGCDKSKSTYSDRCGLFYYHTHQEYVSMAGLVTREEYEIALGQSLSDLQEWHILIAKCKCGHRAKISRYDLQQRFGRGCRISSLQNRLICHKCKKYDSVIEVSSLPR